MTRHFQDGCHFVEMFAKLALYNSHVFFFFYLFYRSIRAEGSFIPVTYDSEKQKNSKLGEILMANVYLQDGNGMQLMLLMIVQLKQNLYHHHHQLVTFT